MDIKVSGKLPIFLVHFKDTLNVVNGGGNRTCPLVLDFNDALNEFDNLNKHYVNGERLFILDCSFEGPAMTKECGEASKLKIAFSNFFNCCPDARVIYITQNLKAIREFNEAFGKYNSSEAVYYNFIVYSYFNRTRFLNSTSDRDKFLERLGVFSSRNSRVLSLNNISKPHRLALVSYLLERFNDEKSYISFLGRNLNDSVLKDAIKIAPEYSTIIARLYNEIKEYGPITSFGEADNINPRNESGFPVELFKNTIFSVITESEFTNGRIQRVTEKTLKTLVCCHDFLMVGNPYTLRLLQDMGFDVTSAFFDTSYDETLNPQLRFELIIKELLKLSSMDCKELEQLRNQSVDQKIKNMDVFTGSFADYSSDMRSSLINKLTKI